LRRFSCWCPKAMAAIGKLPETLMDRCMVITMHRKGPREKTLRVRELDGELLRRKCARFVQDHAEEIGRMRPELPAELNDRAADIWEPLLVLADLAGGQWPAWGREAAVKLGAQNREPDPLGGLLLQLLMCFQGYRRDRVFSRDLVKELNLSLEKPWAEARNGKRVDELWLAQQLRPYGVRPRSIWIQDMGGKGYLYKDLKPLFMRYISAAEIEAVRGGVKPQERDGWSSVCEMIGLPDAKEAAG
jgi:hypothetical protein